MQKAFHISVLIAALLSITACASEPTCPVVPDEARYLSPLDVKQISALTPAANSAPAEVEIGGRLMTVDRVVTGPLCNDSWRGILYVTCDVQVFKWEEEPLFLKECDLSIEPGTVVYVAYHNDAPYYNGCSCHTGQEP